MRLKVLVDNNTFINDYYFAEPAWSIYIECDGKKILLDTGYSDIFIRNANKMGIDLCDLDYIVFSHGHPDHTWGLKYLLEVYKTREYKKPTLIATKNTFDNKFDDGISIGCDVSIEDIEKYMNVNITNDSFNITESLIYLGYIERKSDFENKNPIGETVINNELVPDYVLDDTALVYKANDGIVVITGCSHSGITNIVEAAKEVTNITNIIDIIGGFHLFKDNKLEISKTAEYFKNETIGRLHPCHCADLRSKIEIDKVIPIEEVGVGLELNYL